MSDLGADLRQAFMREAGEVDLTPAAIRGVVQQLGGGEGRRQVAEGNKHLAGQLGVSVRTVQRWQKEGGGEARNVGRSTPGLRISVQGIANEQNLQATIQRLRPRIQERGLTVAAARVLVQAYNESRSRPRNIGDQHIDGANEELINALDALQDGDTEAAGGAFGSAWLQTYGMDVEAEVTDVQSGFALML